jgi:imidazolonepropionase
VSTLYRSARVLTCEGAVATSASGGEGPLGVIRDGAVLVREGRIAWVGPFAQAPAGAGSTRDLGQSLLTPGLVDAHTHAAWVGSRHEEYVMKMRGADYREIAAKGGGIVSSHRALLASTVGEIHATLRARLRRMASLGVVTCEVKSGYGLTFELEERQLLAIAEAAKDPSLPCVVPTFLALHALPPDMKERRDEYVASVCEHAVPAVAEKKLARFVDAYVDQNAFTTDEARRLAAAAQARGLRIRLHVGQFADVGGAELGAELSAASCDHLENVSETGARALADKGVFCTLLPTASFTLKQAPPDVALLRRVGAKLVVASDANPGTAPSESLPLALALAVRLYGLSTEEALLGATRHAALSLSEPDRGALFVGAHADLVAWDLPHEDALMQPWGVPLARLVLREGRVLAGA